jgi:hypothetical protein
MTMTSVTQIPQPAPVESELAAMQAAHDALAGARLQPAGERRIRDGPWA